MLSLDSKEAVRLGLINPEKPKKDRRTQNHANLSGGLNFEAKKDGTPKKAKPLAARKTALSAKQAQDEDDHLMSVFLWLKQWERNYPQLTGKLAGHQEGRLCFHVENERLLDPEKAVTRRNKRTGKEYKINLAGLRRQRKGIKRGISDVLNLTPSPRGFPYFAGELKVRDGACTDEQSEFIQQARAAGAFAHTFWCWPELCRAMLWYFGIDDRAAYLSAGDPRDYLIPDLGGHDEQCGCGLKLTDLIVYEGGRVTFKELHRGGEETD